MTSRTSRLGWALGPGIAVAAAGGLALAAGAQLPDAAPSVFLGASLLLLVAAAAVVVWTVDPAYSLSFAVMLSVVSGNWQGVGVPGPLAPDRLLLVAVIGLVLFRLGGARDCPKPRLRPVHLVLAAAVAGATVSAFSAGTLLDKDGFFTLLEAFGVLPFLVFFIAPVVYRTPAHRQILLVSLVALGAYLGLTALFETTGLTALVFPKYINDPNYGVQLSSFGRARGPFTEAATNGVALFGCCVASAAASFLWQARRARGIALAVTVLCAAGCLFTLQRAVWIGATVGAVIALLAFRGLRRFVVPVLATGAVLIAGALLFVPGLQTRVSTRSAERSPIYERENLNAAAVAMIKTHPLFGVGWHRFRSRSDDYFKQDPDRPLIGTATISQIVQPGRSIANITLHNVFLTYASELGLIVAGLWLAGLVLIVLGALVARGSPELRPWRAALLAYALTAGFVSTTVPPANFPVLLLCAFAGALWSAREPSAATSPELRSPRYASAAP